MHMTHDHHPTDPGRKASIDRDKLADIASSKIYGHGEYVRWTLLEHDELLEVLRATGTEWITGADVMGYAYVATIEGITDAHPRPMEFEYPSRTDDLLERIADFGTMNEFPNNFKIRLLISTGSSDMVMVDYELDEQPEICDDCAPEHLDDHYSCEHGSDYVDSNYSVSVGPRPDEGEFQSLIYHF